MGTRHIIDGFFEERNLGPCTIGTTAVSIAVGTQATLTMTTLGAGVRYVVPAATFTIITTASMAATTVGVAIIDGSTGGTTYLWRSAFVVASVGTQSITVENRAFYGTAATCLTAEFSAGVANSSEYVSLDTFQVK